MLSVIVPLYNEQDSVPELYRLLAQELARTDFQDYELIFVDDGSQDESFQMLRALKRSDPHIGILRMRRNFGKSAALSAGFQRCRGDIIVTLDADLQDRPQEMHKLLAKLDEGWDLVSAWRRRRRDNWRKRLASRIFNAVTAALTGVKIHDINCGFKAYRRKVIEEIKVYGEMHRYIPVLASYRGFAVGEVAVEHDARRFGNSKYGIGRMLGGFFDLLTVIILTRYSSKPLHIFGILGILLGGAGLGIMGYLGFIWLTGLDTVQRPLLTLAVLLSIIGIQFILFGLLAEMIAYSSRRRDDYSLSEEIPVGISAVAGEAHVMAQSSRPHQDGR